MLDDTARKLLIMYHFGGHFGRMPKLAEPIRLSGRSEDKILSGFGELAVQGYICWQPPQPVETAVIQIARETPGSGAKMTGRRHWTD